jgi:hypothetical protein
MLNTQSRLAENSLGAAVRINSSSPYNPACYEMLHIVFDLNLFFLMI